MSWKISRISSSLMALLREREPDQTAGTHSKMEHIREELLACMAGFLDGQAVRPAVWAKVLYAEDIQSLWYLRSDVMHMLCDHCGETLAASKLDDLTELFRGHLPSAQFASARRRG
jgi:hypothetical protein